VQITQVIYALSLDILVSAAWILFDMAGLHLQIDLRSIVDPAIHVQPFILFIGVLIRKLVVANHGIHNRTP
jgi:hypothetical protein